ncbi:PREDICTED: poly(U)-specific endoribonuclease isoform X2 [Lipotes vexillifer]|uniref:Uridylate-specific endoribonuclease n=1 Tax=Lipotes vexillifer TaxID=118797 RepID=A0A340XUR2_LIPVE|nr:PREDICTED: poly(U)-specific endoribonuclease isoform X2 [Lipotes vexillifer]
MKACVPLIAAVLCGLAWAGQMESCASHCNEKFDRDAACQCDLQCPRHGDCCEDYERLCTGEDLKEPEPFLELEEEMEGAPASDLYLAPNSCRGRCLEAFDKHHLCHCNARCPEFGNCCEDFESLCGHEGFSHISDAITKGDPQSTSEKIYRADTNKAQKEDIVLNSQKCISPSEARDRVDRCPEPLFTYVNEKLLSKPTYAAFINLLDNYQRAVGRRERFTAQQLAEQDTFLSEVMKTAVMKELYGFLHQQNRYSTEQEFVNDLKNMWFGLYSRGKQEADSGGFEHVFSGEVKKGKVTGFHNWILFYLQEKEGLVDYYSHICDGPGDSYPKVLALQFSWDGYYKKIGSTFIGSSPEFEFALYSLCFITRPGKVCQLSLGGHPLAIQTYAWDKSTYGNGKKYITTAYVVFSTQ